MDRWKNAHWLLCTLKMIAPLVSRKGSSNPCPILENSNLVPEGVLGQEHVFHYTDSHLFFATIKCKPYSSTTVKIFMALKRDTDNMKWVKYPTLNCLWHSFFCLIALKMWFKFWGFPDTMFVWAKKQKSNCPLALQNVHSILCAGAHSLLWWSDVAACFFTRGVS